jgi:glycosyltransferase involved in cell wall biosynthesis
VEKKGLDLVRRTAELRPDVSWVLAGWGPIDPDAWRSPNVRVMRDRSGPGLAELYRSSDLLVLPSYGEGFPLVIQEALACGLPVVCGAETVAADPQAAPWLEGVAVGEDAVEAAQALSEAIDRVLERGRSADVERSTFAQRRYSWSEAANRYVALFSDLARTDVRPASSCRPGAAGVAEGACAP